MRNAYSIFCIAMAMNKEDQNTRQLDTWWNEAVKLYFEFVNSEFNDYKQSELDCINQFMASKAK